MKSKWKSKIYSTFIGKGFITILLWFFLGLMSSKGGQPGINALFSDNVIGYPIL